MNERDLQNFQAKIAEMELPIHLRELAEKLRISNPTASKVLSILEAQGRVKTKRMGQTWVVLSVEKKQS